MLINEISKKTGISKKAIYVYENRGLLKIGRLENGYRVYSEEDEVRLNKIKLLRCAGISIADIKLLFDDVVTIEELTLKRKKEIETEYGNSSEQLNLCGDLINRYKSRKFGEMSEFNETDISDIVPDDDSADLFSVGIDVGTTTISATVINMTKRRQSEVYTLQNDCKTQTGEVFSEQDTRLIIDKTRKLLDHIMNNRKNVKSIGITAQMHGILYVDENGNAVSNFVTWQDKRAECICESDMSYSDKIYEITGEKVASGFGFATHYYNTCKNLVPKNAYTFCNIADYVAMNLTGRKNPIIHNSIAASFGLFDIKKLCFKHEKILKLGMDNVVLPEVTDEFLICGNYRGAEVSVGIGDNQAAFLGAVDDLDGSILVNIGTGSQISTVCDVDTQPADGSEIRPLIKDKYILCGSALCGGAAYALTEKFFRDFNAQLNGNSAPLYEMMNRLAEKAYNEHKAPLNVNTAFCGTRLNLWQHGSINDITNLNFTAEQLILGVLYGICRELYDFFGDSVKEKKSVVASGNAVQKNRVLRKIISDIFDMPVKIPAQSEEASVGAALFAAVSAKYIDSFENFGAYRKED